MKQFLKRFIFGEMNFFLYFFSVLIFTFLVGFIGEFFNIPVGPVGLIFVFIVIFIFIILTVISCLRRIFNKENSLIQRVLGVGMLFVMMLIVFYTVKDILFFFQT
tara:strand:- start:444 stop:758 length:315 start_codon:yes stop_codon:yes gene_type:complete